MKINKLKLTSNLLLLLWLSILIFNIFDIKNAAVCTWDRLELFSFHSCNYYLYNTRLLLVLSGILIFLWIKVDKYEKTK